MKTAMMRISLALVSMLLAEYNQAAINPKTLVGMWLFDEGTGKTTEDASGNGHKGQIKGPKWTKGKFGKALSFEGNHVAIGNFDGYEKDITIVAWIKTSAAPAWSDIMCGPCGDIILTLKDHKLNFAGQCAKPIPHSAWSTTLLNDDKWHHIAGTYNGSKAKVYVDGKEEAETAAAGAFVTGPKSIGSNAEGTDEFYKGHIDDVAIFNVSLTENDIKTIMKNGVGMATGILAVSGRDKLTTTWCHIKSGINRTDQSRATRVN